MSELRKLRRNVVRYRHGSKVFTVRRQAAKASAEAKADTREKSARDARNWPRAPRRRRRPRSGRSSAGCSSAAPPPPDTTAARRGDARRAAKGDPAVTNPNSSTPRTGPLADLLERSVRLLYEIDDFSDAVRHATELPAIERFDGGVRHNLAAKLDALFAAEVAVHAYLVEQASELSRVERESAPLTVGDWPSAHELEVAGG